ncbi:(Na+)-NQR maturation NqrM [Gilvimarinus chinensis]|uniref:(Na+)-NQR maturation NqrM n=1 Tax=Gilvimarinus chinensis TaxID=396005 RepID=UPI0003A3C60A|nr:(Na+)-NQR maturation NqrM [Gilvimarinus chinensis]
MAMFMVALCVMLLVVAGMAVGVMFGRKPLTGSCGGVGQALGEKDYTCELCGGDEAKCESLNSEDGVTVNTHTDLAVDATSKKR